MLPKSHDTSFIHELGVLKPLRIKAFFARSVQFKMPFTKDDREFEIKYVLTTVPKVDVKRFKGNREEVAATIDK